MCSVFWDLYCAAPDRRETCEHSSEAKAFHDYVSHLKLTAYSSLFIHMFPHTGLWRVGGWACGSQSCCCCPPPPDSVLQHLPPSLTIAAHLLAALPQARGWLEVREQEATLSPSQAAHTTRLGSWLSWLQAVVRASRGRGPRPPPPSQHLKKQRSQSAHAHVDGPSSPTRAHPSV